MSPDQSDCLGRNFASRSNLFDLVIRFDVAASPFGR
jgi:hypothetical protein